MKVIGITGRMHSGKSTLCKLLAIELNVPTVNVDHVVSELYKDEEIKRDLQREFSRSTKPEIRELVLGSSGSGQSTIASKLKEIFLVKTENFIRDLLARFTQERQELVLLEAPLLFEDGFEKFCDHMITVCGDERTMLERAAQTFRQRCGRELPPEQIESFANLRHWTQAEKVKRSNAIVDNNGTLADLKAAAMRVLCDLGILKPGVGSS